MNGPETKLIRNGALLKGAVSRAYKWLASVDCGATKDEGPAERLSASDLGILGLGSCSEEDDAFQCPGWLVFESMFCIVLADYRYTHPTNYYLALISSTGSN